MWVRRNHAQVEALERAHRRSRLSPRRPALYAGAVATLDSLLRSLAWQSHPHPGLLLVPASLAATLLHFILTGLAIFAALYCHRIYSGASLTERSALLCSRCFTPAPRQARLQCPCGGTREPQYLWRWQAPRRGRHRALHA